MRTIPIVNLPGSFPAAAARSGGRIVRAVGDAYTGAPGNWAPASRPVRAPGGVYTAWRYDVVRKEGAQDGDSRSSVTGAGRGWRGVPGAGRVSPAGAAGALLPDAPGPSGPPGRPPRDECGRPARPPPGLAWTPRPAPPHARARATPPPARRPPRARGGRSRTPAG